MTARFFASLDSVLIDERSRFQSKVRARTAVFTWVEGWCKVASFDVVEEACVPVETTPETVWPSNQKPSAEVDQLLYAHCSFSSERSTATARPFGDA